jgi:hypothetical protein
MWYDVGAIILYFHSVMENTNWITIKKNTNLDGNEGFEVEEEDTSDAEIRAIEEKINQARKHFTKLPLFESLQPKEGFSTKNGLIKFDKKEKNNFNNIINKIKQWTDPETIINRVVSRATKNTTVRTIATTYLRNMFYAVLVIFGTYNIYNIRQEGKSDNKMTGNDFEFIVNSNGFRNVVSRFIYGIMNITSGHHRFLIAFVCSIIGVFFISNPFSFVVLSLSSMSGNKKEGLQTLLKSPLIPFIIIFGIFSQIMNIPKITTAIEFLTKGIMGYMMASCISFVCMILFTPFACIWFSLTMFKLLFMSADGDDIKRINDEVDLDINNGETRTFLGNVVGLFSGGEESLPEQIKRALSGFFTNPTKIAPVSDVLSPSSVSGKLSDAIQGVSGPSVSDAISQSVSDVMPSVSDAPSVSGKLSDAIQGVSSALSKPEILKLMRINKWYDKVSKIVCSYIIVILLLMVHFGSLLNTKVQPLFMWIPPIIGTILYLVFKHADFIGNLFQRFDDSAKTYISTSS